jgi:hypothetical protein
MLSSGKTYQNFQKERKRKCRFVAESIEQAIYIQELKVQINDFQARVRKLKCCGTKILKEH